MPSIFLCQYSINGIVCEHCYHGDYIITASFDSTSRVLASSTQVIVKVGDGANVSIKLSAAQYTVTTPVSWIAFE